MERCDFSSVIRIISQYISATNALSQPGLVSRLFEDFTYENSNFSYDDGLVCRWFKGVKPISPDILNFYEKPQNVEQLAPSIEFQILPLMYDVPMAAQELKNLVINDVSISDQKRTELISTLNYDDNAAIAGFISSVLRFSMARNFVSRKPKTLTSSATLSPVASERIFDGFVPRPCKHFCGRENELNELHELLSKHNKIFVSGIAGIGKSEFVKAYAAAHSKDYTNILYFTYPNRLKTLIADMDFADDLSSDSEQERFKKHNRFLRSLKEDTLIIIDNFNTTASEEPVLEVLMKYSCKIVFTTRCRFEIGQTYELKEISDIETLLVLSEKLYPETKNNREAVTQIIEIVHRHTFTVELAARLLQSGISEPNEVLQKLSECSVAPEAEDKIKITKDGKSIKATYYSHIRALFSLYLLSEEMKTVMRCMAFVPISGIYGRLFANWAGLSDMNCINDLVELGFVQENEMSEISLHPIVQEITVADLSPSVTNCETFLHNLQYICLGHGTDIPYYGMLFAAIENIIASIKVDDPQKFLRFIEDAFSYMEKHEFKSGMTKIIEAMKPLVKSVGSNNDRALLLNNQASVEGMLHQNYTKGISLIKQAISVCNAEENIMLAANLYMNIGVLYQNNNQIEHAKKNMEQGMNLLQNAGIISHDIIIMAHNYARLLAETGEPRRAVEALKRCAELVKATNTDMCTDYADIFFDIGALLSQIESIHTAEPYFKEAFRVYRELLTDTHLREKCESALKYLRNAGAANIPDYLAIK